MAMRALKLKGPLIVKFSDSCVHSHEAKVAFFRLSHNDVHRDLVQVPQGN